MAKNELKNVKNGKTPDQQKVIEYFGGEGGCFSKSISDEEYDNLVLAKLNDLGSKSKALSKIGMDDEQVSEMSPTFFHGFENYSNKIGDCWGSGIGKDGRFRTTNYSATWFFFSDEQVLIYNVKFDMCSDAKIESTEEYFYRDITNFSTISETEDNTRVHQGKGCLKKEKVEKSSTECNRFSLTVPGDRFTCSVSGVSDVDSVIKGMKNKLREKKSQR